MIYRASWDTFTKIVTAGVTLLFLVIFVQMFTSDTPPTGGSRMIVTGFMIFTYGITYYFRPVNYRIEQGSVVIQRPFDKVKIDRADIAKVELLNDDQLRWTFRTFGVGGLFGYFGMFYNGKIGSMKWYATRRRRAVLIRKVNGERILITPDEAEDFVSRFEIVERVLP